MKWPKFPKDVRVKKSVQGIKTDMLASEAEISPAVRIIFSFFILFIQKLYPTYLTLFDRRSRNSPLKISLRSIFWVELRLKNNKVLLFLARGAYSPALIVACGGWSEVPH